MPKLDGLINTCKMIAEDCEKDVRKWEGAAFTGKNVSEMHGEVCAMIAALANILQIVIEEVKDA